MASRYAGHPVIVNHDGSAFGLEDTRLLVHAVRALLSSRGIGRGERILIVSGGHLEVLITCWAAWLDGVVVAVIDPATGSGGVRDLVRELDVRLTFADSADVVPDGAGCEVITFDDMSSSVPTGTSFSERIKAFTGDPGSADEPAGPLGEDAAALVLCTSGSSGAPKKVELSQGSLFRTGDMLARLYHWDRGQRLLSLGPMYSMSGLRNPAVAALHAGATIVVPSPNERAVATGALRSIERHAVNIVTTVPAFLENVDRLLQQGRTLDLQSLKQLLTTASPTDIAAQRRVSRRLCIEIADYYGLTETGGLCIAQRTGLQYGEGVVGTPAGCLCEIRAPDGTPVAQGETGELHVYSDNLMKRYLGDPQSGLRIHGGWLATGDRARIADNGDVELLGRLDGARKNRQGEFVSENNQHQGDPRRDY
jgi:acyl-coenzyme A synthetase/AMP-(fatty) acid ligase